jgi:DMSO/TMAO reductase YedYZ molybdopterin-dependent catalytic subunit
VAGLITAAVALGIGQLVAGVSRPQGSPVAAVGGEAIDLTPLPVKNFAISAFGSHDKMALVIGVLVILAIFSAWIGVLAMRRLGYGFAGLAVFGAIGLAAALNRPGAMAADALPTLAGVAAGALVLRSVVRAAHRAAPWVPAAQAVPPPGRDPWSGPDDRAGGPSEHQRGTLSAPGDDPADDVAAEPAGQARASGEPGPQGRPGSRGRRSFLTVSSVAVVAAGVSALAGRSLAERSTVAQARATVRLPRAAHRAAALPAGTDFHIKGLSPFITPNGSFYRVDTALILPEVPPRTWQLRIHGMVEREITINFADLLRRPLIEDYITLCCVSNPVAGPYISNAKWLGTSLASLLRTARPRRGADQLLCTSADGFTSGTPIATVLDGRDAMLAVGMNGTALPVAHGFPVRMVVPGLYGYVSACKWLTDINVTTYAAQTAYWSQRGWSRQAPIKTESRIDVPSGAVAAGRTAVAGEAWAQHKGIDAVHVRVDRGPWRQARLAAVPGIDTWRQWMWEWDATRGTHTIEARATDATGYTQTALQTGTVPNGATGYPSITVNVS